LNKPGNREALLDDDSHLKYFSWHNCLAPRLGKKGKRYANISDAVCTRFDKPTPGRFREEIDERGMEYLDRIQYVYIMD
jgi:hypothetical protein